MYALSLKFENKPQKVCMPLTLTSIIYGFGPYTPSHHYACMNVTLKWLNYLIEKFMDMKKLF